MKCSKCQFDNPEGIDFCGKCGANLERICPSCNFINPPEFRFCGKCGQNLYPPESLPKELSFDEKLAKIQRYLPKDLTQKILAQRDKIEGERKQVTVMFCDIEGFTPLTERIGSEEVYSLMDEIYEILIHKVFDYEGTVNELTGDGIMALFGAPIALEDAPQRAIRSALAIHREMSKFSDKLKIEKRIPTIKMRIGIHTGPVIVGILSNDLRVEFKAVGDTVNLASRMEGLAEPGATYVTEDTFKLTEGFFRFEALGEKKIKGKERPVKIYQVIAPSTRRTKFDVSAERGLTPLVGRERELELLLDGFQRAKIGKGQAFSIVSEAGCGKSRLLYEFRKAVANEDINFLEGKCLSYSRGAAYHPVIDILRSTFDIHEEEGDQEIRERVKKGLELMGVDQSSTLPYLLELLSVKESGIDWIPMSPEARKDRIIEAIKRIVLKGSEMKPLIIAIEDLHWMDRSSEDVIRSILESIPGTAIFLMLTYRPEFVHTWGIKSYHNQLILHRLSNKESFEMVNHILGSNEIEKSLEEFFLERTEGVPFFIEQFIKSLNDLKIIEKKENVYRLSKDIHEMAIPSTIQDVIMARVDSLPERAKEVLQAGSVIEREFSYPLINLVTGFSAKELLSHLSILKDSELLYERGIYPQSNYIFKHALTREVVYGSILTGRKKRLHEQIGNAIEHLYKDNLHEHYELLVEHYIKSENYEKAAKYSRFAQRKAEKRASLNCAIEYAEKRVLSLERLPRTDDWQDTIIEARITHGLYWIQMVYPAEARKAIDPIIESAVNRGDKKRLSQIYTILGTYNYLVEEDFPKAFNYLEEALRIIESQGDIVPLVFASFWLGMVRSVNCEFEKAFYNIQKALDINIEANSLWGISVVKSNMSYFGYYLQGRLDLSYETSHEAVNLADKSGDILSKAMAYVCHGIPCYDKGLIEEAKRLFYSGIDFCERINLFIFEAIAHFYLGEVHLEMGESQKGKDHYAKAIWLLENHKIIPSWQNIYKVALERAKAINNERNIDLESLYGYANKNKARIWDGWIGRYIAEILLSIGDSHINEAEHWIKKAIRVDSENGLKLNMGRDYLFYSKLLRRKGDNSGAVESFNTGLQVLRACGIEGENSPYLK